MHIHLDLLGGLSGDMFIGAIVDCFPDMAAALPDQLARAGFGKLVRLDVMPQNDGTLTGTRFHVAAGSDAGGHDHRHYSQIIDVITASALDESTRDIVLAIFRILAEAEAGIHGKPVASIAFHEIGAWDSIADIVCASSLIAALGDTSWSVSSLPLGRGRTRTAHGELPVPAPATARILEGFQFHDDGIGGERITPTGAAILRQLAPDQHQCSSGALLRSGYGFGTRKLAGMPNVTRALVFETTAQAWSADRVLQLEFDIDDQTPEELAVALERLRAVDGVVDVSQGLAIGKKGRQLAEVRILATPNVERELIERCFKETTTLGVRRQILTRAVLDRSTTTVVHDNASYRVKLASRPGAMTVKAEMDDIAAAPGGHLHRRALRQAIERKTGVTGDE